MESVSTDVTIYYNQSVPFLIRSFVHTTRDVDSARIRDKKFTGLLVTCKSTKFPLTHDCNKIIARRQKLCSPTEANSYHYKKHVPLPFPWYLVCSVFLYRLSPYLFPSRWHTKVHTILIQFLCFYYFGVINLYCYLKRRIIITYVLLFRVSYYSPKGNIMK